jgi:hypothetical protein
MSMAQPGTPGHTTTVGPVSTSPAAGGATDARRDSDWPVQAADAIERVVGGVRDKTTGPAISVARAVVYGTLAGIVGIAVLVMLAIIAVRVLDIAAREILDDQSTWLAHLVAGAVFCVVGAVLWSKRRRPDTE